MLTAAELAKRSLRRAGFTPPNEVLNQQLALSIDIPDIIEWAESEFYIVETRRPIVFQPHQKDILRLFTERKADGAFLWRNCLYSTIKKSGKTTISAMYARWSAETWGPYQEVYNLGNKLKQAKERAFKAAKRSIQMSLAAKSGQWDVQETKMTHLPSGSIIEALPISGAGEAGGNPSLTVWTELWGFQYEEALLMWDELKPVPTRPLSQRFVDTYAGFEGESILLKGIWDRILSGKKLHDELPVYGDETTGWIGYIDQGEEARRMPWQRGPAADEEFRKNEADEEPERYRRHWENKWANSTEALINVALWDRLEEDDLPQGDDVDVVLAADASINGDCTALAIIGYDQKLDKVLELETFIWTPDKEHKMDYDETLVPEIERALKRYRVLHITYDPYQLHNTMTQLRKRHDFDEDYVAEFKQGQDRLIADADLVNRIRQGKFGHSGNQELRDHVQNADGHITGESGLRIVKRSKKKPIDGLVAVSMGSWRIAELLANPDEVPFVQGYLKDRVESDW